MDAQTRNRVRARAAEQCEYCHLPQSADPLFRFHVEHVVARQHEGGDHVDNLALACHRCNFFKGPNLSAIDSESGAVVLLFNPRTQEWDEHFEMKHGEIVGKTPIGRATVKLLVMNEAARVLLRRQSAG